MPDSEKDAILHLIHRRPCGADNLAAAFDVDFRFSGLRGLGCLKKELNAKNLKTTSKSADQSVRPTHGMC